MAIFYSASRRGFFDDTIHSELPADAREISDKLRQEMLDAQANGKLIEGNSDGLPVAVDPPPPDFASRYQMRVALHEMGLLQAVEEIMADPATDMLVRIGWQELQSMSRSSRVVQTIATQLALDDAALTNLFINASKVNHV